MKKELEGMQLVGTEDAKELIGVETESHSQSSRIAIGSDTTRNASNRLVRARPIYRLMQASLQSRSLD